MKFIDTNVLYYKFSKSYAETISHANIVSINALEFLKNIEKVHPNRSKYYIPHKFGFHNGVHNEFLKLHGKRPFHSSLSDSIIFEFKQNINNYVMYNNESIANVINEKLFELYKSSISFLDKVAFKELKSRFKFIVDNNLVCHSLTKSDIDKSYELLEMYIDKHNIKPDFRNSWNDILILSKVINCGSTLISYDKELNRFAAELYGAKVMKYDTIIEYSFPANEVHSPIDYTKFESKGYVNDGWTYRINKRK